MAERRIVEIRLAKALDRDTVFEIVLDNGDLLMGAVAFQWNGPQHASDGELFIRLGGEPDLRIEPSFIERGKGLN